MGTTKSTIAKKKKKVDYRQSKKQNKNKNGSMQPHILEPIDLWRDCTIMSKREELWESTKAI